MKFLFQDVPELSGEKYKLEFIFSREDYSELVHLGMKLTHKATNVFSIYSLAVLHNAITVNLGEVEHFKLYKKTIEAFLDVDYAKATGGISESEETYEDDILNFNKEYFKFSLETCLIIGEIIREVKETNDDKFLEMVEELDDVVAKYIAKRISEALGGTDLMIELDNGECVRLNVGE